MSLIALHKGHVSRSTPQDSDSDENPVVRMIVQQHHTHKAKQRVKESLWFVIPFVLSAVGVLLLY